MEINEKFWEKCELARKKWIRKLEWIMSLKAGDIVTRVTNMPESLGHTSYNLWPVEFVKRSYMRKLVPSMWADDIMDLRDLEPRVTEIPPGAQMMLTGVTEPGYLNDNCDRFAGLDYFYADSEKRKQIVAEYEAVLGPGAFYRDAVASRYSLLIPYPQVMILGSGKLGYVQPNGLKRLKGGTDA